MSKEAFTTNVKFLALKSGWALMVRQTKPDPNISKKGVTEVAQN